MKKVKLILFIVSLCLAMFGCNQPSNNKCGYYPCPPGTSCYACGGGLQCVQPGTTCCGSVACPPGNTCLACSGRIWCVPQGTTCVQEQLSYPVLKK